MPSPRRSACRDAAAGDRSRSRRRDCRVRRPGGQVRDPAVFGRLSDAVNDVGVADEDRLAAISALGAAGDSRAAPLLWSIVVMRYPSGFIGPDVEARYRETADVALSRLFRPRPPEYPDVLEAELLAAADMRRVVAAALTGEARPDAAPKADEAAEGTTGYRRHRVEGAGTAADVAIPAVPYRRNGASAATGRDASALRATANRPRCRRRTVSRLRSADRDLRRGARPENRDAARVPSRARAAIAVHPLRPVIRAAVISNVVTTPAGGETDTSRDVGGFEESVDVCTATCIAFNRS